MPTSVVIAVAASWIGTAVAGSALAYSAIVGISWVTYAGIAMVATVIAGLALTALAGSLMGSKRSSGQTSSPSASSFASSVSGRTQIVRSSVANRTLVYGRQQVSGPLVFAAVQAANLQGVEDEPDIVNISNTIFAGSARYSRSSVGDTTASVLHLVIPVADHEIDAIESVQLGDDVLTLSPRSGSTSYDARDTYDGYVNVAFHHGTSGDPADAALVQAGIGWTGAHRLTGIAHIRVSLLWSPDVFPTGIPNVKAVIRGKKLHDPRTGLTVWSQNFALAVRDYLLAPNGLGAEASELSESSFIATANIADETLTLADGSTEKRFTCNGVVDLGSTPRQVMEGMLTSGAGTLVWSGGKYILHPGAYTTPTYTLNADDLRGSIKVRPRIARRDLFNAVRGTFVNPAALWQPDDFPVQTNPLYATQDGVPVDQPIFHDITLEYTTSSATAQRLAKLMLERSRQGITVEMPCNLRAFRVSMMDTVRLDFPQLGWSGKEFKVLGWSLAPEGGVDLVMQEEVAASYDWNSGMQTVVDPAPDTNLPDTRTVLPPGLPVVVESLYETTGSAGVKARLTVTFVIEDLYPLRQYLRYRLAGTGAWINPPPRARGEFIIDDVAPGTYEFQAQTQNVFDVRSAWTSTVSKEALGLSANPEDVRGFTIVKYNGQACANWFLCADLDVRQGGQLMIRHSPLLTGALWADSVILDTFGGNTTLGPAMPLLTGTYLARFLDSTGNYSVNPATFVATEGMTTGFSIVLTSDQHPNFTGAKDRTYLAGPNALQLTGSTLVDDLAGPMDSIVGLWDSTGGIATEGTYLFDNYLDMVNYDTYKVVAYMSVHAFDVANLWDDKLGLVDDMGLWDGADITTCDATLYASTTADDPTVSPVWSPWAPFFVNDFTCRAMRFKLALTSGNPEHTIECTYLRVQVLVPV